jgi:hypothetical protein
LGAGVSAVQLGISRSVAPDRTPTVSIVLDHAEENNCIAREIAMHFIEHLVSRYGSDEQATSMLKNSEIVILPVPTETTG